MTDDAPQVPAAPEPFGFSTNIIDTWKLKNPSVCLLLPPEFFPIIGKIATTWGMFEILFETFLMALYRSHGITNEDWRGLTFRKRRVAFATHLETAFASMPTARAYVRKVLDDIEPLYIKRNLAVHGQMQTSFTVDDKGGGTLRLQCRGRYKGKEIEQSFTADELDDLYYEIAHLCGRLNVVSTGHLWMREPPLPEISLLRDFLTKHHPTFPNPAMLSPQPKPSQESGGAE